MALSPAQIHELLKKAEPKSRTYAPDLLYKHGFDKAALFLLNLRYDNMFEPWLSRFERVDGASFFRCKGCGRKVKRSGAKSHFDWHKRELLAISVPLDKSIQTGT